MKCAHDGCKCPEARVEKNGLYYCCAYCANSGRKAAGSRRCGCGHPTCH